MKKLAFTILTLIPMMLWAHQDRYSTYEYNNVTVRFKTGFFYEEINNAKIIGEYAALLSDSLDYDQPILLDFIHDYGYTYQGKTFSFINFGSDEFELVSYYKMDSLDENRLQYLTFSDSIESLENLKIEVETLQGINQKNKIVIRQFGFHFDIKKTIRLLYFAINNKTDFQKLTITDTLTSYLSNSTFKLKSLPNNLIDSIASLESKLVKTILEKKVYLELDSVDRHVLYYSYYSRNGQYEIYAGLHDKEIILDTLNQVYSFKPRNSLPEVLFVFSSPILFRKYKLNTFFFPEYKPEKSKRHQVPIDPFEYIVFIDINWIGDDIYSINYSSNFFKLSFFQMFPYLAKDDILVENFEEYINSYRKENK